MHTSTSSLRPSRSVMLQAALLAALLAGVAIAVAGIVPGSSHRLEHAAPGWIALEVIFELVALAAYTILFHRVFSGRGYQVSHVRSAQIGIGELGAFVVVPAGAGGPALRFWALMRGGMPFRVVMTRSVIHAVVLNLPYIAAAFLLGLSVAFGIGPGHAPLAVALAPSGVVAGSVLLALAATLYVRSRRDTPRARWRRIGREVIQAIPAGVRELPARLREPVLPLAAAGYWVGDCGVLVLAFHAAHGSAPIGVVVLAYMLGQLGNAIPLPGGVGGIEPIMLGVLTASGVNAGLGAAAIVLYRLVSLGLQAVAGAIAITTLAPAIQRSPTTAAAIDR